MLNEEPGKEARFIRAHELLEIEKFFGSTAPTGDGSILEVPLISWVAAGKLAFTNAVVDLDHCERVPVPALDPAGDWIALQVKGTSMDRISPPDSIIIVNRRDKKLIANACYVIADEGGAATYKRYRPSPVRFEPVSVDDSHQTIFPDNEPNIVGRVRMSILKM